MSTEHIPTTWDADRDERFFRLVAHVFPCSFVEGASALLAANDAEILSRPVSHPAPAAPALVPVRVAQPRSRS